MRRACRTPMREGCGSPYRLSEFSSRNLSAMLKSPAARLLRQTGVFARCASCSSKQVCFLHVDSARESCNARLLQDNTLERAAFQPVLHSAGMSQIWCTIGSAALSGPLPVLLCRGRRLVSETSTSAKQYWQRSSLLGLQAGTSRSVRTGAAGTHPDSWTSSSAHGRCGWDPLRRAQQGRPWRLPPVKASCVPAASSHYAICAMILFDLVRRWGVGNREACRLSLVPLHVREA